jgi:hypothetical protein
MWTMSARPRGPNSANIGSLLEDPRDTARRILQVCIPAPMTIWVDDRSVLHANSPADLRKVSEHAIVGTYQIGIALAEIEEDLHAARRERASSAILDEGHIVRSGTSNHEHL